MLYYLARGMLAVGIFNATLVELYLLSIYNLTADNAFFLFFSAVPLVSFGILMIAEEEHRR